MTQYKLQKTVEDLIDTNNVDLVLLAIVETMEAKCVHLAETWQDYDGSRNYHNSGVLLDNARNAIYDLIG